MTTVERVLRVYAVTSAFGGCFDDEFQDRKRSVLRKSPQGQFIVVVSNVTLDELD